MSRPIPEESWFDNIPEAMRKRPQWCWAKCIGNPVDKAPLQANGRRASVTNPKTWTSFEVIRKVVSQARANGYPNAYAGYILTAGDSFAGIDLDTYKADELYAEKIALNLSESEAEKARQRIIQSHEQIRLQASTYTEISQSGRAGRLIGYGSLAVGRRGHNIEAYSSERFLIMTGNRVGKDDIADIQPLLDYIESLADPHLTRKDVKEAVAKHKGMLEADDQTIIDSILNASNGDRYHAYFYGGWQGDRSRCIADLLQNIARYSGDIGQIRRIAESTAIVQSKANRYKAGRKDLLGQEIEWAIAKLAETATKEADSARAQDMARFAASFDYTGHFKKGVAIKPPPPPVKTYPYGKEGSFRRLFYDYCKFSAVRDVDVVHRARVLFAMSSLFAPDLQNPDGDGLALYLMLIAPSGIGKDAFRNGIAELSVVCESPNNQIGGYGSHFRNRFFTASVGSGQGAVKATQNKDAQAIYTPEYFKTRNAKRQNDAVAAGIEAFMLDSFNRCKPNWRGSDEHLAQEVRQSSHPCTITMGCEGTAEDFKTVDLMAGTDGAYARQLVFYYDGPRPYALQGRNNKAPESLLEALLKRLNYLQVYAVGASRVKMAYGPDAAAKAYRLDCEYTDKANQHGNSGMAVVYTRAQQIIMRIAGLISFDNALTDHQAPKTIFVTTQAIDEAQEIYESCLKPILDLQHTGEVGTGTDRKRAEVMKALKRWFAGENRQGLLEKHVGTGIVMASCVTQFFRAKWAADMGLSDSAHVQDVLEQFEAEGLLQDITESFNHKMKGKRGRRPTAIYTKGDKWHD